MFGFPTKAELVAHRAEIIRETMGQIALIHGGDQLTAEDMRNAVTIVEQELKAIQLIVAGSAVALPILTLAAVAARGRARADVFTGAKQNPLVIIQGGKS
jgi:hypothetical protein